MAAPQVVPVVEPPGIVKLCSLVYPQNCCHDILVDFNFHETCLKLLLTKSLGYGIIAGATIVKVPQVLKLLKAKSSVGLSFVGVFLELLAITFGAAYAFNKNYPFSAWGESLFMLIETAAIAFLVLFYDGKKSTSVLFLISFTSALYVLMSGLTPVNVLWTLQASNLPLVIVGKLLQAFKNYSNSHTGQLSAITTVLLLLGSTARIFTSIQETGDNLVVLIFVAATFANLVLFAQLVFYWKATNQFLLKESKKKQK